MTRVLLCLAAIAAVSPALGADPNTPTVTLTPEAATVAIAGQKLSAALADGKLTLETPARPYHLTVSILHGDGWATPERCTRQPRPRRSRDAAQVSITYPVAGEREFVVELAAYRGVPALFVTSRLVHRKHAAGDYYYWSTDATSERYTFPGEGGPREATVDLAQWTTLPHHDWLFLPGDRGGLAVLPTNVAGRAPGAEGSFYLHALPRSTLVGPGDALRASFGLAGVESAAAAAKVSAQARRRRVPALALVSREAAKPDYGPPAPDWVRNAGVYNLYYRPAAQWTDDVVQERLRHLPFIVGSTPDKAALERCHRARVRLLHYVIYTCLLDTAMQVREGGTVYSEWLESIDHERRDLKDHPDWVCIGPDGKVQKDAWGQSHGHPGLLNTCLHQPGLQEAALRQVRLLMEMGFDGVFVDLAGPTVECYGPKFGKHTHPDPTKTNTEAYAELLARIYQTVKRYGRDRVVMQNTCTGVLPGQWRWCDMQMLEAFPFGSESGEMTATWPELQWAGLRHAEAVKHGKLPVLLPYLSKVPEARVREASLFSFAYAHLYGFLWADAFTLHDRPEARAFAMELYRVRLGKPKGAPRTSGTTLYRAFENGLALLNPSKQPVTVQVPAGRAPLADVGYGRALTPSGGTLTLELAPESGRVLLRKP